MIKIAFIALNSIRYMILKNRDFLGKILSSSFSLSLKKIKLAKY